MVIDSLQVGNCHLVNRSRSIRFFVFLLLSSFTLLLSCFRKAGFTAAMLLCMTYSQLSCVNSVKRVCVSFKALS